jgi:hypothetical protein
MGLIAMALVRAARATKVVWLLIVDRRTRRRLPWTYLRHRVTRNPIMVLQLVGIAAAALFYPASYLLPQLARRPTIGVCAVLWLAAGLGPLVRQRHRKS